MEQNAPKYDSESYERYLKERSALVDAKFRVAENYDKAFLTLTGGALAISMTFIANIVKNPIDKWSLIIAWICLGLGLALHLFSCQFCGKAYGTQISELDKEQQARFDGKEYKYKKNKWSSVTKTFNYITLALFLLGIVFLAIFVITNISIGDKHVGKTKTCYPAAATDPTTTTGTATTNTTTPTNTRTP